MARNIKSGTVMDVRTTCEHLKCYRASALPSLKRAIRSSGGKALVVTHPMFLQKVLGPGSSPERNAFLTEISRKQDYAKYLTRLRGLIRKTDLPVFVFAERNELEPVSDWLLGIKASSMRVLVPTHRIDPEPNIDGVTAGWKWFGGLSANIGLKRVSLAGELYYFRREQALGCLATAQVAFWKFDINTEILHRVAYPSVQIEANPAGKFGL